MDKTLRFINKDTSNRTILLQYFRCKKLILRKKVRYLNQKHHNNQQNRRSSGIFYDLTVKCPKLSEGKNQKDLIRVKTVQ